MKGKLGGCRFRHTDWGEKRAFIEGGGKRDSAGQPIKKKEELATPLQMSGQYGIKKSESVNSRLLKKKRGKIVDSPIRLGKKDRKGGGGLNPQG